MVKGNRAAWCLGAVVPWCLFFGTAHPQVLTTAETLGKGKHALLFTENRLFVEGVQLNIVYGQYVRGLSHRFDLYASVGASRIFEQNQAYVGVGGNYHFFNFEKVHVSSFNIVSSPLHRHGDSSTVLLNSALVVSRSLGKFWAYSGINLLVPIGAKERGLFTPATKKTNVPVGASFGWGKSLVFVEGDFGKLKAVGVGVAFGLN